MIVVTRHRPLVEYLLEIGLITPTDRVIEHATEDDVRGQDVIGVLPMRLAALASSVTEVPLELTLEDREAMTRGDLPIERIREWVLAEAGFVPLGQGAVRLDLGRSSVGLGRYAASPQTEAMLSARRSS